MAATVTQHLGRQWANLPSCVMFVKSVMILEGFFLLLGGAGADRGMSKERQGTDKPRTDSNDAVNILCNTRLTALANSTTSYSSYLEA